MSGRLVRKAGTAVVAAVTAGTLLASGTAMAAPGPGERLEKRSVPKLLTDLQTLYRQTEEATERYNGTEEKLRRQQEQVGRLNARLAKARVALHDSRGAAGRLARQQYQGSSDFSSYVRLLLARDPQQALDQTHVLQRVSLNRVETVDRLADGEKEANTLAASARKALDDQLTLAERQKRERDDVQKRLGEVEKLLASLTAGQLAELARLEAAGTAEAQRKFVASGALSSARPPSSAGNAALRYAVEQIGKPYEWGAEGPGAYDCSGLTSQAWAHAGQEIPRTSQEQWDSLERVPLGELRPGDLVLYFPGATHVGIYLGDGMVVQAPRPGAAVKVSPIAANPVLGAVRPDPSAEGMSGYRPPVLPAGARDGSDAGYGLDVAPSP
ncbi:NlpC/P60 family protein [Streptomyces sp. NPDC058001]|uniref:C40 family peptidase n=1 Tax=Streptomyces sp. NPDC058001 TaxID=3346300 RepID=UPI0036ECB125